MQTLADLLNTISAIDPAAMSRAQRHIDGLLKPVGSLGRLEALAIQLAGMPGLNGIPHVGKKAVLVMCADHGVWEEGVAISPKEVGNDSNLLIVFYVQIMPDDFVMQLHRF
ncbi:Nicotinate-nucleotide--dimethylbenzimidazole phosphoribosyltransferase [Escherichia coli]|nr:Nicotinate-nucleotide--dimethylbenzimidazole phosphoribosyltransferase [Escherichia coli]